MQPPTAPQRQSAECPIFPVVRLCKSRGGFPLCILFAGLSLLYSYGYLQVICLSCGGYEPTKFAYCHLQKLLTTSCSLAHIYIYMFLSLTRFLALLRSELSYSGRCRRDARLAQITCTLIRAPTAPPHVHPSATIFDLKCNLADYEFLLCSTYFLLLPVAGG